MKLFSITVIIRIPVCHYVDITVRLHLNIFICEASFEHLTIVTTTMTTVMIVIITSTLIVLDMGSIHFIKLIQIVNYI